ncbi:MAG: hypothetical protein QXE31_03200 [Candidatus Woesearchaeota archaeon]
MRGRPSYSKIRENISEILFYMEKAHGYDIYKIYCEIFPKVTQRSIYYNLKKGYELNEFEIEVKKEEGNYSWGNLAEKVYYKLGKNAKVSHNELVADYFFKKNKESNKT